jgi:hypothetical protein
MSLDGRVTGPVRRITLGVEQLRDPSTSRDGRIVFAAANVTRVIERVPLGIANDTSPPVRLYANNRPDDGRSSQTRDGMTLVLPRDREIWIKDLRTGKERFLMRVEGRTLINATVSPDGARIAYNDDSDGYIVETASRGGFASAASLMASCRTAADCRRPTSWARDRCVCSRP